MAAPKSLIINSPYERPTRHWVQGVGGTLSMVEGRRPAGYEIFDTRNNTKRTADLELVNRIRERVDEWRDADYPGITTVTRRLLEHWRDTSARQFPLYFCQIEAIETLIWYVEAPAEFRQGIHVPGDGGDWERLCSKMATGSGKTTVMAMIITWQVLNALTYPKETHRFSKAVFIVAPGITVKDRLQVLYPGNEKNEYDAMGLCPDEPSRRKLNQADILVENWHTLMPLKQTDRSVVKKGAESDKAFVRRVLDKLSTCKDLVVINDEAHHAYRIPADIKISKKQAEEAGLDLDEATRWIEGLDRIHKQLRIRRCFDLSATPFAPTGGKNTEAGLFDWVISDFGLNDAIEAGLVKTPRVVVRDTAIPDANTLKSKLYHLYREAEVAQDLNRKGALPYEPLPLLVQQAYTLLGADWKAAYDDWKASGHTSPPVMLTVCNRIETAARIEDYFNRGDAHWQELHAPNRTLQVNSKVLEKAEMGEKSTAENLLKVRIDTLIKSIGFSDEKKKKLEESKKDKDRLALLATYLGVSGDDFKRMQSKSLLGQFDAIIENINVPENAKKYLLESKGYIARLSEIIKAACLPKDRETYFLDMDKEEMLRAIVDSVGKRSQPGQGVQNVISVAMLSEGWDAKNVTHIMGLRAFTSQLLCEQVIGRGLRRVGYETEEVVGDDGISRNLFKPEYVNVFGVPLSIFQDVGEGGDAPPPPKPSTQIESLVERSELEIRWPNLLRVDTVVRPHLTLDWDKVELITINPDTAPLSADLAPAVGGATDWGKIQTIDLELLPEAFRQQRLIFVAARKAFDQLQHGWKGSREYLVVQLIRLVEQFLESGKIDIPSLFHQDPLRRRILFALCMDRIVQHLMQYIHQQNQERIEPVFDPESPIGSTRFMRTWYTTKPCQPTQRSQISHLVADSAWEAHAANVFESESMGVRHLVSAYAKNDHLGFQIHYLWNGAKRRYVPDFLVRLSNGRNLILEIKGEKSDQTKAKHAALQAWIQAVNAKGGFGLWCSDIAYEPSEMQDIIRKHAGEALMGNRVTS